MTSTNRGRADWRVLTGAAFAGSGVGLGLGAAYLVAGMAEHVADHARARETAQARVSVYAALSPQVQPQTAAVRVAKAPTRARELDCLADAVYFEARGEDVRGQAAVAQVVLNRVRHPAFPKSVCAVVFQGAGRSGCQFSFACDGSMRRTREAGAWTRARRVAARALAGVAFAEVGSATHFHTLEVAPAWGDQMRRVAQVGEHVFYRFAPHRAAAPDRLVLTAGPAPEQPLQVTPSLVDKVSQTLGEPTPGPEARAVPAPTAKPAEAAGLKAPQPAAETAS